MSIKGHVYMYMRLPHRQGMLLSTIISRLNIFVTLHCAFYQLGCSANHIPFIESLFMSIVSLGN